MLNERYSNPQILISAHMQKFVLILSVINQHDLAGLRKLFDQIEPSVRNLKSLKVETNSYRSLFVPLLNEKLLNDMRERITRKFDNNVWSLDDMLNFLKKDLEAEERFVSVGASITDKRKQLFDTEVFSSSTLLNPGFNSNHKKERRPCVFCGLSNHKSQKHLKITNPSARNEICKKNKNCFVCFEIVQCKFVYQRRL